MRHTISCTASLSLGSSLTTIYALVRRIESTYNYYFQLNVRSYYSKNYLCLRRVYTIYYYYYYYRVNMYDGWLQKLCYKQTHQYTSTEHKDNHQLLKPFVISPIVTLMMMMMMMMYQINEYSIFSDKNIKNVTDPFETQNRVKYLTPAEKDYFHNQLQQLLSCRGPSCRRFGHSNPLGKTRGIGTQQSAIVSGPKFFLTIRAAAIIAIPAASSATSCHTPSNGTCASS